MSGNWTTLAGRCVTSDELDEASLLAEIAALDPAEQGDLLEALAADPAAIGRLVAHARLTNDLVDEFKRRELRSAEPRGEDSVRPS